MIKFFDYYVGYNVANVPKEHQDNTVILIERVNKLLSLFGEQRGITSGYRSMEKHKSIYEKINSDRVKQGLDPLSIPMASKHLIGAAVDIEDAGGKLKAWLITHPEALAQCDLYCEDYSSTKTWTHFQCISPKSGRRVFPP